MFLGHGKDSCAAEHDVRLYLKTNNEQPGKRLGCYVIPASLPVGCEYFGALGLQWLSRTSWRPSGLGLT